MFSQGIRGHFVHWYCSLINRIQEIIRFAKLLNKGHETLSVCLHKSWLSLIDKHSLCLDVVGKYWSIHIMNVYVNDIWFKIPTSIIVNLAVRYNVIYLPTINMFSLFIVSYACQFLIRTYHYIATTSLFRAQKSSFV